jgi:hypothetical protein
MQIFNSNMPKKFLSEYEVQLLHDNNDYLKQFQNIGADVIFYWYGRGDYCGTGKMLCFKDSKWWLFDLSHCSCYGPLSGGSCEEGFHLDDKDPWIENLNDARDKCTDDFWLEIELLVNLAIENGYDTNRKKSKEKFNWLSSD